MNARQQITAATYGSSLSASYGYDSYGYPTSSSVGSVMGFQYNFDTDDAWLNNRRNTKHSGCYESFTYDNLERLDLVKDTLNNVLLDIDYAANGNITKKTDVSNVSFGYNNSSKPYALTDIEAVTGLVSDSLQTVSYTSFEQVSAIDEGNYHAAFTYNSDNQRAKMLITESGSTILTRWYAGSRYMKETAGSTTKEYTYIGGDAYTAPVVAVTQGGTTTYYYLLRDHLGSVTHLVNTANTVVAEYSYDAWGRRRVDDNWDNYNVSSEPDLFAGRGFTGHEYLPWFNLYNMNGRLYDPIVSRCLSPDENVSFSDFTQSYNRYSYALNNPLSITDPDGENPLIILGAILGGWIGMGQAMINSDKEGWGLVGDMAKGLFLGAASGVVGAWGGVAAATAQTFGAGALIGGVGAFGSSLISGGGNALLSGTEYNISSALIAGGIGALTGGLAGAANAHMANLQSNNLLAYEYTVDIKTGVINKMSDLGGANLHFYQLGYATDGGSAFVHLMTQVVEGANTINSFRFWQSAASTISAFSVPASGLTGYFMEPGGPDSNMKNSGRRIPEGQYDVVPHWRAKHYGRYSLQNSSLLGDRNGILMHYGRSSKWTEGCLLPACNWTNNTISGSLDKLNALQLQIDKAKLMKVNIFNAFY